MKRIYSIFCSLAVCAFLSGLSGCATTDPNADSDLPWNTPQQWEGAPSIPGLGGGGF